jgi:agmatinase
MFDSFLGTFKVDELDSAIDVNAVILGIPYEDMIEIYPTGAANAPNIIRQLSNELSGQSFTQQNIHTQNVLDLGNIKKMNRYEDLIRIMTKQVSQILGKKALPLIVGGDHSIALGTASGIMHSNQPIDGIVWIDAHLDLMNEYPHGNKNTRATVLRRIYELDQFKQKKYYFIGSRGHNLGVEEINFVKSNKMEVLEAKNIIDYESIDKFLKQIKENNLYVSLDMDVLDPAYAPGVSVPEPGGLSTRELFYILNKLASKIKCFEIVEVNPKRDINNITSLIACKTIFEILEKM